MLKRYSLVAILIILSLIITGCNDDGLAVAEAYAAEINAELDIIGTDEMSARLSYESEVNGIYTFLVEDIMVNISLDKNNKLTKISVIEDESTIINKAVSNTEVIGEKDNDNEYLELVLLGEVDGSYQGEKCDINYDLESSTINFIFR